MMLSSYIDDASACVLLNSQSVEWGQNSGALRVKSVAERFLGNDYASDGFTTGKTQILTSLRRDST